MLAIDPSPILPDLPSGGEDARGCRSTFLHHLSLTDPSNAISFSSGVPQPPGTAAIDRLQRTRANLASQRNQLLVGLRVVNSVEKETISAEYENFVLDEMSRCRQAKVVLERSNESDTGGLGSWWGEYCGNCQHALDAMKTDMVQRWQG